MAPRPCPNRAHGCKCDPCEAQRAYQRAWAKAHHDPVKAKARRPSKEEAARQSREWARRNREKVRALRREHYKKNGPGYWAAWRSANRDRVLATATRYRNRHPGRYRVRQDANPEAYLARRKADREAKKLRGGSPARPKHTTTTRRASGRFARMDTCALCFLPIYGGVRVHALKFTRDHIVAVINGGKHEESNLQPAHFCCNASKGTKDDVSLFWIRAARKMVLAHFRKEVELRRAG